MITKKFIIDVYGKFKMLGFDIGDDYKQNKQNSNKAYTLVIKVVCHNLSPYYKYSPKADKHSICHTRTKVSKTKHKR